MGFRITLAVDKQFSSRQTRIGNDCELEMASRGLVERGFTHTLDEMAEFSRN